MLNGEMQCHFMKLPETPCLWAWTNVPAAPQGGGSADRGPRDAKGAFYIPFTR